MVFVMKTKLHDSVLCGEWKLLYWNRIGRMSQATWWTVTLPLSESHFWGTTENSGSTSETHEHVFYLHHDIPGSRRLSRLLVKKTWIILHSLHDKFIPLLIQIYSSLWCIGKKKKPLVSVIEGCISDFFRPKHQRSRSSDLSSWSTSRLVVKTA